MLYPPTKTFLMALFFYYSTRDGDGVGAAGSERESGGICTQW